MARAGPVSRCRAVRKAASPGDGQDHRDQGQPQQRRCRCRAAGQLRHVRERREVDAPAGSARGPGRARRAGRTRPSAAQPSAASRGDQAEAGDPIPASTQTAGSCTSAAARTGPPARRRRCPARRGRSPRPGPCHSISTAVPPARRRGARRPAQTGVRSRVASTALQPARGLLGPQPGSRLHHEDGGDDAGDAELGGEERVDEALPAAQPGEQVLGLRRVQQRADAGRDRADDRARAARTRPIQPSSAARCSRQASAERAGQPARGPSPDPGGPGAGRRRGPGGRRARTPAAIVSAAATSSRSSTHQRSPANGPDLLRPADRREPAQPGRAVRPRGVADGAQQVRDGQDAPGQRRWPPRPVWCQLRGARGDRREDQPAPGPRRARTRATRRPAARSPTSPSAVSTPVTTTVAALSATAAASGARRPTTPGADQLEPAGLLLGPGVPDHEQERQHRDQRPRPGRRSSTARWRAERRRVVDRARTARRAPASR